MKTVLVDLSRELRGTGEGAVPPVREGKFVRIRAGRSVEFLVLADGARCRFHADVAESFCTGGGRSLAGHREEGRFVIDEPGWSVAGGGRFRIDEAGRSLSLGGRSAAYGRFDGEGLAGRLADLPALAGWTVKILP